jgi:hypothetical protein
MKRWNAIAVTLTLASSALAVGQLTVAARGPQAPSVQMPSFSNSEIKKMTRQAHTPEQYQTLADFYRGQQQSFKDRARGEWAEAIRRSQFSFGTTEKWPRPVDSSMNRYQYFSYEARQMAGKAEYFEKLSSKASQADNP